MSPHETLFLESTNGLDIKWIANNSLVQFQIWDFPGDFDFNGKQQKQKTAKSNILPALWARAYTRTLTATRTLQMILCMVAKL